MKKKILPIFAFACLLVGWLLLSSAGQTCMGSPEVLTLYNCVFSGKGDNLDNWAITPEIDLSGVNVSCLAFFTQYQIENNSLDVGYIKISSDGGETWTTLVTLQGSQPDWKLMEFDLTPWVGRTILIAFEYSTGPDSVSEGWHIYSIFVVGYIRWYDDDVDVDYLYIEDFEDYPLGSPWGGGNWIIVGKPGPKIIYEKGKGTANIMGHQLSVGGYGIITQIPYDSKTQVNVFIRLFEAPPDFPLLAVFSSRSFFCCICCAAQQRAKNLRDMFGNNFTGYQKWVNRYNGEIVGTFEAYYMGQGRLGWHFCCTKSSRANMTINGWYNGPMDLVYSPGYIMSLRQMHEGKIKGTLEYDAFRQDGTVMKTSVTRFYYYDTPEVLPFEELFFFETENFSHPYPFTMVYKAYGHYEPAPTVGGIVVPVDKFGLLSPYFGLASTILVATVATSIYAKHVKRRKEKQ